MASLVFCWKSSFWLQYKYINGTDLELSHDDKYWYPTDIDINSMIL